MTYREKLEMEKGQSSIIGQGCPYDHKYEEMRSYSKHCKSMSCEECWDREIVVEAYVVDGTMQTINVVDLMKGGRFCV